MSATSLAALPVAGSGSPSGHRDRDRDRDEGPPRSFLTDVDVRPRSRGKSDLLDNVRKDHARINDLVNAFRGKVDLMVDKQRTDFLQAYEHHIFDVHKELQFLREKVNEIANDKARNEKMQQLDAQQTLYRSEALRLDGDTGDMQKRLRHRTAQIQSIEKERDWLVTKLRQAKKRFEYLKSERARLFGGASDGGDMSSLMSEANSQLTIDVHTGDRMLGPIVTNRGKLNTEVDLANWRYRINNDFKVTRDSALFSALPQLTASEEDYEMQQREAEQEEQQRLLEKAQAEAKMKGKLKKLAGPNLKTMSMTGKSPQKVAKINPAQSAGPIDMYKASAPHNAAHLEWTNDHKKAVGELVSFKIRQEEIRTFVTHCSEACNGDVFTKHVVPRPLEDLLDACTAVQNNFRAYPADYLRQLAHELAATPETYYAISDLLAGRLVTEEAGITQSGFYRSLNMNSITETDMVGFMDDLMNNQVEFDELDPGATTLDSTADKAPELIQEDIKEYFKTQRSLNMHKKSLHAYYGDNDA